MFRPPAGGSFGIYTPCTDSAWLPRCRIDITPQARTRPLNPGIAAMARLRNPKAPHALQVSSWRPRERNPGTGSNPTAVARALLSKVQGRLANTISPYISIP